MIKTLLVDDEEHNRHTLRTLLETHCPRIAIIGEAGNAEDAHAEILRKKPDLVFLDIKMPKKSAFDLLKQFEEIDFEVIFVTAFDKYAIKAFEFNALGYILKPIDLSRLLKVVEKVSERILKRTRNDVVLQFVRTLSDANNSISKLNVHHHGKVILIELQDIVCIESKDDNTCVTLTDKKHYYSSKRISEFESVLEVTDHFLRIDKSIILNIHHIKSYSKGDMCIIEMRTGQAFEVSRRRKSEILKRLKA